MAQGLTLEQLRILQALQATPSLSEAAIREATQRQQPAAQAPAIPEPILPGPVNPDLLERAAGAVDAGISDVRRHVQSGIGQFFSGPAPVLPGRVPQGAPQFSREPFNFDPLVSEVSRLGRSLAGTVAENPLIQSLPSLESVATGVDQGITNLRSGVRSGAGSVADFLAAPPTPPPITTWLPELPSAEDMLGSWLMNMLSPEAAQGQGAGRQPTATPGGPPEEPTVRFNLPDSPAKVLAPPEPSPPKAETQALKDSGVKSPLTQFGDLFQGNIRAPNFGPADQALADARPEAPELSTLAERVAGLLSGAARGARGAQTTGELLLGAGAGAQPGLREVTQEDQRRKERFQALEQQYDRARTDYLLAKEQAKTEASNQNVRLRDQRQLQLRQLEMEQLKLSRPYVQPLGEGAYSVTKVNPETGRYETSVEKLDTPSKGLKDAIALLKLRNEQLKLAKSQNEVNEVRLLVDDKVLKLPPEYRPAVRHLDSNPEFYDQMELRAMHRILQRHPDVVEDFADAIPGGVAAARQGYTGAQAAAIREAFNAARGLDNKLEEDINFHMVMEAYRALQQAANAPASASTGAATPEQTEAETPPLTAGI